MKYIKLFEYYKNDLVRNLSGEEAKYYLEKQREIITKSEFDKLRSYQFCYYYDADYIISYDIESTVYNLSKRWIIDKGRVSNILNIIQIVKVVDDWWIVTWMPNKGSFPNDCTFLCDTIEGVREFLKYHI